MARDGVFSGVGPASSPGRSDPDIALQGIAATAIACPAVRAILNYVVGRLIFLG